jgi:integrase/recombinase XerC
MLPDHERELQLVPVTTVPSSTCINAEQLLNLFLSGRSALTIVAYRGDLEQFAAFLGAATPMDAVRQLLDGTLASANVTVLSFRNHLISRRLASATVNRKLASLRAIVTLARMLGVVLWQLEIPNVKARRYRDTRGPGDDGIRKLLGAAGQQVDQRKAARDVALIHVLHDIALRRGEVCGLDRADLDLVTGRLTVVGKGQTEPAPVSLPRSTQSVLRVWLSVRGDAPGPLFLTFDITGKAATNGRLTGGGLWSIIRSLGRAANLKAWPHGLRHTAITRALDATDGDLRRVQRFSRHRDVRTLMLYDDNRQDLAAGVAELVSLKKV